MIWLAQGRFGWTTTIRIGLGHDLELPVFVHICDGHAADAEQAGGLRGGGLGARDDGRGDLVTRTVITVDLVDDHGLEM